MEENQQRKFVSSQKIKSTNLEYDHQEYNPFGKQGSGAPLRDENGSILTVRAGYFSEAHQNNANQSTMHNSSSPMRSNL